MKLRGKVAILTGAAGGIGATTARAFAREGAHVVLADLESTRSRLDALASELDHGQVRAIASPTDITRRSEIDRLVSDTMRTFNRIDILANIAGVGSSPSLSDCTDEEIERVISVNLLGSARMIHAVLPIMKAQRSGRIINIGSIASQGGVMGIYSASKFGLRGLTDSVRREVRSWGVGVTLIDPGFVATQMNAAMKNLPKPDIVANAAVRAAVHPRRHVIVPASYQLPVLLVKAFPGLTDLVFSHPRIQERLNRDSRAARAAKTPGA